MGTRSEKMDAILKKFHKITKDPELFLSIQEGKAKKAKALLKEIYDLSITNFEGLKYTDVLEELEINDSNEEQIWQQLELWDKSVVPDLLEKASHLLALSPDSFTLPINRNDQSDEEGSDRENYDNDSEEYSVEDDERNSADNEQRKFQKFGQTIVDDKFFKLREMEAFLEAEDLKENRKQKGLKLLDNDDEEEINYFEEDISDEEDVEDLKYMDFFDPLDSKDKVIGKKRNEDINDEENYDYEVNEKENSEDENSEESDAEINKNREVHISRGNMKIDKNGFAESDENEEEAGEIVEKSTFELRQERLQQKINEYEEDAIAEKPWQLKGEVVANSRPKNSLLEEVLDFDHTTRPAPIITEETTMKLEDIIRQRIKDKAWDDVERKMKPIPTANEFRKQLILDQEKSKESLAQIYEKDYREQMDKLDPSKVDSKQPELVEHREIKRLMRNLFIKLDALSNFHYTPKPVIPEIKIITNTPVIEMEEVAPVAMSDGKLLAPEEVKSHAKGEIKGKGERTDTDKNRERRKKKLRQKFKFKDQEKRLKEKQLSGGTINKTAEKTSLLKSLTKHRNVKLMEENNTAKVLKTSSAFFSQLQHDVSTVSGKKKKPQTEKGAVPAKRYKL